MFHNLQDGNVKNAIRQVTGMKNHVLFAVVVKKIEIMNGEMLQGTHQKQNA
jgi:hypothetical protein